MLGRLFGSKLRARILAFFFQSASPHYAREAVTELKADPSNVHRELRNLCVLGVLVKTKETNASTRPNYSVNTANPYYPSLKKLFETYTTECCGNQFFLLEEMSGYYPLVVINAMDPVLANGFFRRLGLARKFSASLTVYKGGFCAMWMLKNDFDSLAREIIELIVKFPSWCERYTDDVLKKSDELRVQSSKLFSYNLVRFSNAKLYKLFLRYFRLYADLHVYHWIQTATDFGDSLFTRRLMEILKEKIGKLSLQIGDVFSTLTSPIKDSNLTREHVSLLHIASYVMDKARLKQYMSNTETRLIVESLATIDKKLDSQVEHHVREFGFLGYGFSGPVWDKAYFIDILASMARQNARPHEELKKLQAAKKQIIAKQAGYIKLLGLNENEIRIFEIARGLVYGKGARKDCMFYYSYAMEALYREIGRRFYLSLNQVRYMYPHEVKDLMQKKQFNAARLNARLEYHIHHKTAQGKEHIFEGAKARSFVKKFHFIKYSAENVKLFQGDCASPGRARGIISIINTARDMEKMKHGNILVSTATSPDLMPAIRKAAAIVTDTGGITCHAAIVSRELGIPCVIGTKIATHALKDGDTVEIDATHGKVIVIGRRKQSGKERQSARQA